MLQSYNCNKIILGYLLKSIIDKFERKMNWALNKLKNSHILRWEIKNSHLLSNSQQEIGFLVTISKSFKSVTKTYCRGLMKPWPSVTIWGVAKGIDHGFLSDRDHMIPFLWRPYKNCDQKVKNTLIFIKLI